MGLSNGDTRIPDVTNAKGLCLNKSNVTIAKEEEITLNKIIMTQTTIYMNMRIVGTNVE